MNEEVDLKAKICLQSQREKIELAPAFQKYNGKYCKYYRPY